ncbi:MAG: AraC family transcriptional regulator [Proteobacteria bacterium]|nr:AraC family transcriptional regulator [Pseudomonadota bacterium]
MAQGVEVRVRFHRPPGGLARYFTTFYLTEVHVAGGGRVRDSLHPEWANLRFAAGSLPAAHGRDGQAVAGSSFMATGPSARALQFELGNGRIWGLGLTPLGWARFVGLPAADHANMVCDGFHHPSFAPFAELGRQVFGAEPDEAGELARMTSWFAGRPPLPPAQAAQIIAVHTALVDPRVASVSAFAEAAGLGQRTLERVCARSFGFAPKLLLRRQRFMRSLAQFMLEPSSTWIAAIDEHYVDQSHFVREFREFMGVSPRQYAVAQHPILSAVVRERARYAGAAVQALDPAPPRLALAVG